MIEYFHLDKLKGSTKGLIGELLFKYNRENIFCTQITTPDKIEKLPFKIPEKIKQFLQKNWYSLDCFSFKTKKENNGQLQYKEVILYEIKTKNYKYNENKFLKKLKFTDNEIETYKNAKKLGIDVELVQIIFFENWKYSIQILEFNPEKYKYKICNGSRWQKKTNPITSSK